jgi:hypothetical protein
VKAQVGLVRRLALVLVWMAAASAVAVLGLAIYEVKRSPPIRPPSPAVDRLPARQNFNSASRWTVTEHLSAHNVLIAHVETTALQEAVAIAQQLTDPIKEKYAEVLIYFHRPGRPDVLPPVRVQWTRQSGYVETRYEN